MHSPTDKDEHERGHDPPDGRPGVVVVGSYALEFGRPSGTIARQSSVPAKVEDDLLARALREQHAETETERTAAEAAGDLVDEAGAATAKVERAVAIGKGVAAGDVLDPAQLGIEADALLDLLERLDRNGRAKEALQLARSLSKLYSLLRRWAALLRALEAALRAGEKLGDLKATGWAKHELGTLQLAGGDFKHAERTLAEAREIRRRLGDPAELAATDHNLRVLSKQMLEGPHGVEWATSNAPARTLGLLPALAAGAVLFVVGVAGGAALGSSGDSKAGPATTITETATNTPAGDAIGTETVTETETITETVTVESRGGSAAPVEEAPGEEAPLEEPRAKESSVEEAPEEELP